GRRGRRLTNGGSRRARALVGGRPNPSADIEVIPGMRVKRKAVVVGLYPDEERSAFGAFDLLRVGLLAGVTTANDVVSAEKLRQMAAGDAEPGAIARREPAAHIIVFMEEAEVDLGTSRHQPPRRSCPALVDGAHRGSP